MLTPLGVPLDYPVTTRVALREGNLGLYRLLAGILAMRLVPTTSSSDDISPLWSFVSSPRPHYFSFKRKRGIIHDSGRKLMPENGKRNVPERLPSRCISVGAGVVLSYIALLVS